MQLPVDHNLHKNLAMENHSGRRHAGNARIGLPDSVTIVTSYL